jgi:hypothetical protein
MHQEISIALLLCMRNINLFFKAAMNFKYKILKIENIDIIVLFNNHNLFGILSRFSSEVCSWKNNNLIDNKCDSLLHQIQTY